MTVLRNKLLEIINDLERQNKVIKIPIEDSEKANEELAAKAEELMKKHIRRQWESIKSASKIIVTC